jgi:hypothetical protein
MRVHKSGSFQHRGEGGMSTAATIETARDLARKLEQRERVRVGSVEAARSSLARRAGVSSSTWRNLTLGRLKRLDAWMRDRLQALLVRELEAEIMRLGHELEAARQCGDHLASQHVCEVEAHLAAARAILNGEGP